MGCSALITVVCLSGLRVDGGNLICDRSFHESGHPLLLPTAAQK